jgi:hypothetical protein
MAGELEKYELHFVPLKEEIRGELQSDAQKIALAVPRSLA